MHRSESAQRPRAKRGREDPLLSAREPSPSSPPRSGRGRPPGLKRKRAKAQRLSEEAELHAAAAEAESSAVAVADRTRGSATSSLTRAIAGFETVEARGRVAVVPSAFGAGLVALCPHCRPVRHAVTVDRLADRGKNELEWMRLGEAGALRCRAPQGVSRTIVFRKGDVVGRYTGVRREGSAHSGPYVLYVSGGTSGANGRGFTLDASSWGTHMRFINRASSIDGANVAFRGPVETEGRGRTYMSVVAVRDIYSHDQMLGFYDMS